MGEKYRLRGIHLQMVTEAIGTKAIIVHEEWNERYRENQETLGHGSRGRHVWGSEWQQGPADRRGQ